MGRIFVLAEEEIVILFGLLGIEGIILENPLEFYIEFEKVIQDPQVELIIISENIFEQNLQLLLDFKVSRNKPIIIEVPNFIKKEKGEDLIRKLVTKYLGGRF
ncbi:MAG: hypothetical protein KAX10_04400 [Candidatus Lokiarchaeota archaeon]|nr:hypothetical protein [Candidatus Lokiarchaeota archaeon]